MPSAPVGAIDGGGAGMAACSVHEGMGAGTAGGAHFGARAFATQAKIGPSSIGSCAGAGVRGAGASGTHGHHSGGPDAASEHVSCTCTPPLKTCSQTWLVTVNCGQKAVAHSNVGANGAVARLYGCCSLGSVLNRSCCCKGWDGATSAVFSEACDVDPLCFSTTGSSSSTMSAQRSLPSLTLPTQPPRATACADTGGGDGGTPATARLPGRMAGCAACAGRGECSTRQLQSAGSPSNADSVSAGGEATEHTCVPRDDGVGAAVLGVQSHSAPSHPA